MELTKCLAMIDFDDINYLKYGNEKQRDAFQVLSEHQVFKKLKPFDPFLAGTIPIAVDIETSDLDISCNYEDKQNFITELTVSFAHEKSFGLRETKIDEVETVIANFMIGHFEVEVFGQPIPVKTQNAYRHLIIEYQILAMRGEVFRQEIIKLKRQGLKTEPAFASLLGLNGNPYAALLAYSVSDLERQNAD